MNITPCFVSLSKNMYILWTPYQSVQFSPDPIDCHSLTRARSSSESVGRLMPSPSPHLLTQPVPDSPSSHCPKNIQTPQTLKVHSSLNNNLHSTLLL